MERWICVTCGTQFPSSQEQPQECPICRDQRQYVGHQGQQWTTLAAMQHDGYRNTVKDQEPHLVGLGTTPKFAIGQRALLLRSEHGNVLWDCITLLDDETIETVQRLGGLSAIAISHPHYYSCMVEWAERFDVPIYLHEADRQWVMRPSEHIVFWAGDTHSLHDDLTLIRLGGHFPGGTVLHWPQGDAGKGVVLSGDIIQVVADRNWVSFMLSFPNLIPLPAAEVFLISEKIKPYKFNRLYGAWWEAVMQDGAAEKVQRSADRYIRALEKVLPVSNG
jgi:hypothetical protein